MYADTLKETPWSTYMLFSESVDKEFVRDMKVISEGVLVFTGLFATIVAGFLVQSYDLLSPAPQDRSEAILAEILVIMRNNATGHSGLSLAPVTFSPPDYAIWLNSVWSLSMVLSIFSAFMATLVQQWVRRYLNAVKRTGSIRDRALLHATLRGGVDQFAMRYSVDLIIVFLHCAVALFVYGLVLYLGAANKTVARVVEVFALLFLCVYTALTILPMICPTCPYSTPLSEILHKPLAGLAMMLCFIFFTIVLVPIHIVESIWKQPILRFLRRDLFDCVLDRQSKLDRALLRPSRQRSRMFVQGLVQAFQKDADVRMLLDFMTRHPESMLVESDRHLWSLMLRADLHSELARLLTFSLPEEQYAIDNIRAFEDMSSRLIEHSTLEDDALVPLIEAWRAQARCCEHDPAMLLVAYRQLAQAQLRFLQYPSPTNDAYLSRILYSWEPEEVNPCPEPDYATFYQTQGRLFNVSQLNLPLPPPEADNPPSEFTPLYMRRYLSTLALISFVRSVLSVTIRCASSGPSLPKDFLNTCKPTLDALAEAVLADLPPTTSFSYLQLVTQLRLFAVPVKPVGEEENGMRATITEEELRAMQSWTDARATIYRIASALSSRNVASGESSESPTTRLAEMNSPIARLRPFVV